MADIYVRAPNGEVVVIDDSQQQAALDQGYAPVDEAVQQQAQQAEISAAGEQGAVTQGLLTAPEGYESEAAKEKLFSAATFGMLPGLDSPAARARGLRFQAEHPGEAFAYEVAGQLPLAVATGAAGEAVVAGRAAAGLGRAAMAGVRAADFAAQAAVGGAQTEAEQTRLAGDDFSWTDAAVAGVAGEALGRGAGWAVSRAVGGAKNLVRRAEREAISDDVDDALSKGGWLNDYRVAHHAEQYQNELADLAARDLDNLETNFAEVSRQDRKRARVVKLVEDQPETQNALRVEAHAGLTRLRDAVSDKLVDAPSPAARSLLKQIDERIADLEDPARTGRRLWRTLDENRQALQEFQQDLHQAYENNPGSAWLSRDGLSAVDAAEKSTREALLREDAWGKAAADAQRAYNTPFNEKYFPTQKTVKGKLMFSPYKDARGFDVFQGDPAKVRAFFSRDVGDVDGARLAEQFRDYLDGVEAIARAGEADAPAAARETLESVRRLRKAAANAEYVSQAVRRTGERGKVVELGAELGGAAAATAAAGPFAGAAAFGALRGARSGDWLFRAARRMGWDASEAKSMAKLLERDALPAARGANRSVESMLDDLVERGPTDGPPSAPPSGGGGGAPPGGLGPSGAPAEPLDVGIFSEAPRATAADQLGAPESLPPEAGPSTKPTRFVGEREVGRGQVEALETDPLREAGAAGRREAPRLEALRAELEQSMRRDLESIRAAEPDLADDLEQNFDELVDDEVALASERAERATAPTEAPPGAPSLDEVDQFYAGRTPSPEAEALAGGRAELDARIAQLEAREGTLPPELDDLYRRRNELALQEEASRAAEREAETVGNPEHVEQTKDLVDAAAEQGFQVRDGIRTAEAMAEVFKPGKVPTPEQWKNLAPVHLLEQLGDLREARIVPMGGTEFSWMADGQTSIVEPHIRWDGTADEGGYPEQAWSIARTFSRNDAGLLEVHHDHFNIRGDLQGTGVGAKALKSMMEEYRKIGVNVVSVDSVEVGKYFWPSIGFDLPKSEAYRFTRAKEAYVNYVQRKGLQTAEEAQKALARVTSMPSLAQAEFGKEFLLNVDGPWNFGLRLVLKDENPLYHLMRGRLDIAAGVVAAMGAGALEGAREGASPDGEAAAQASAAPLAGFAAAAALFKQGRGRLVRSVAKALFAAAPEATLKTVARLAYSRAQVAARQEEFQSWQANPQELVDRVAEGLRDAPPEAFAKTAQGVFAAAGFLREKLPQSAKPSPVGLSGAPVSAEAAAKYARYEQAALHPKDALREAAQVGYLSPELLETLQELYPDLLAEVRVEAYQAIRDTPHPTIQARTTYARLFDGDGALADPAFSQTAVQMVNLAYEQQAQPKPPAGGAGPRPGVSQTAAAVAAPTPWRTG